MGLLINFSGLEKKDIPTHRHGPDDLSALQAFMSSCKTSVLLQATAQNESSCTTEKER